MAQEINGGFNAPFRISNRIIINDKPRRMEKMWDEPLFELSQVGILFFLFSIRTKQGKLFFNDLSSSWLVYRIFILVNEASIMTRHWCLSEFSILDTLRVNTIDCFVINLSVNVL